MVMYYLFSGEILAFPSLGDFMQIQFGCEQRVLDAFRKRGISINSQTMQDRDREAKVVFTKFLMEIIRGNDPYAKFPLPVVRPKLSRVLKGDAVNRVKLYLDLHKKTWVDTNVDRIPPMRTLRRLARVPKPPRPPPKRRP